MDSGQKVPHQPFELRLDVPTIMFGGNLASIPGPLEALYQDHGGLLKAVVYGPRDAPGQ